MFTVALFVIAITFKQPRCSQRMDKENVAHLHITVLLSSKNNDILNFACKWMELENIILSDAA